MSILKRINNLLPFNLDRVILLGYRGSIAHGTYISQEEDGIDDKDVLGIAIPPIDYYFGIKKYEQTQTQDGDLDLVVYEFKKFIRLLSANNPNVLSLLWLRKNHYLKITKWGQRLIDNRDIFLSKLCYKTFGGYAYGQLRRMEKFKTEGYMGQKRKQLIEKRGYDVKNGSHLIRLLKMGVEILTTGEVNVFREDSQLYIAIKRGEWSLERVKNEADRLFKLLDEAYVRSKLPNRPDYDKINKLSIEILIDYFKETIND